MLDRSIDNEIAAYDAMKADLEKQYFGKWVVFFGGQLQGAFDEFDAAAKDAIKKFGRGPYLIRKVGECPVVLPASVVYSTYRNAS